MPFGQRFDRREAFCRRSRSLSSSPAPQKKEQGSGSREKKSEDRSDPDEDHRDMESAAPLFEHVDPRLGSSPLLQMDYRRTQAYDFYHKRSTRLEINVFSASSTAAAESSTSLAEAFNLAPRSSNSA